METTCRARLTFYFDGIHKTDILTHHIKMAFRLLNSLFSQQSNITGKESRFYFFIFLALVLFSEIPPACGREQ